jgi:hypothetical protein
VLSASDRAVVMAWIESHQTLPNHPKTLKVARALGIDPAHVVGHLHCLWYWGVDYAETGSLTKFDEDDIEAGAQWCGEPGHLFKALVDAGFIEEKPDGYSLHDWWQYAGKLIQRRREDVARKRKQAHAAGMDTGSDEIPSELQRNPDGDGTVSIVNRQRNRPTVTNQPTDEPFDDRFPGADPRAIEMCHIFGYDLTGNHIKQAEKRIAKYPGLDPVEQALDCHDHHTRAGTPVKSWFSRLDTWMSNSEKSPPWATHQSPEPETSKIPATSVPEWSAAMTVLVRSVSANDFRSYIAAITPRSPEEGKICFLCPSETVFSEMTRLDGAVRRAFESIGIPLLTEYLLPDSAETFS